MTTIWLGKIIYTPSVDLDGNRVDSQFLDLDPHSSHMHKSKQSERKTKKTQFIFKKPQSPKQKFEDKDSDSHSETIKSLKQQNLANYEKVNNYLVTSEDILLGKLDPKKSPQVSAQGQIPINTKVKTWYAGEIPYALSKNLPEKLVKSIEQAIDEYHKKTSIRFVPYNGDKDAVLFDYDKDLCASFVGRLGGHQPILLNEECTTSKIIHEIMHVLGFIHEQQRENRDKYVDINFDNIIEAKKINFSILPFEYQKIYERLTSVFDYNSVTLYDKTAFARNKEKNTLTSKKLNRKIQPSQGLSVQDVLKIKEVYVRGL